MRPKTAIAGAVMMNVTGPRMPSSRVTRKHLADSTGGKREKFTEHGGVSRKVFEIRAVYEALPPPKTRQSACAAILNSLVAKSLRAILSGRLIAASAWDDARAARRSNTGRGSKIGGSIGPPLRKVFGEQGNGGRFGDVFRIIDPPFQFPSSRIRDRLRSCCSASSRTAW